MQAAAALRDQGHGTRVSYSRKVFIPLTRLCRDCCRYCTFAHAPRRGVTAYLAPEEWAYWYEGRPAERPLADPFGEVCVQPGDRREGGSHMERMSMVRVWNTFMDEHTYLVRRWNEFLAA